MKDAFLLLSVRLTVMMPAWILLASHIPYRSFPSSGPYEQDTSPARSRTFGIALYSVGRRSLGMVSWPIEWLRQVGPSPNSRLAAHLRLSDAKSGKKLGSWALGLTSPWSSVTHDRAIDMVNDFIWGDDS